MSDLSVQGKIYKIFEAQQVTPTFTKREFVVITDEQYPQHIKLELIKDSISLIDTFKEGQEVNVHFNLRGREWTKGEKTSYFISLNAWRIEAKAKQAETLSAPPFDKKEFSESGDDLPF